MWSINLSTSVLYDHVKQGNKLKDSLWVQIQQVNRLSFDLTTFSHVLKDDARRVESEKESLEFHLLFFLFKLLQTVNGVLGFWGWVACGSRGGRP